MERRSKTDFIVIIKVATLLTCAFCAHSVTGNTLLSRHKRFVLWKQGASRLQVIVGVGVPLGLKVETVIIGTVLKGNYKLPINISNFEPPEVGSERKKRSFSFSRWEIYDMLAQAAQTRGLGDGKSCVLRTICELSRRPIDKNNGLFDELAYILFDPKGTDENIRHRTDNDYFTAQTLGKSRGRKSCKEHFPYCTTNLIEMFTI